MMIDSPVSKNSSAVTKTADPSESRINSKGRLIVKRFTDEQIGRQRELVDPFAGYYNKFSNIIPPPLAFSSLYTIYEQSDILQSCVNAMINNIDGFGYLLDFIGNDVTEKDSPQAIAEYEELKNFFDQVNEDESFQTVRRQMRLDYEVTGNACLEIVRFPQSRKIAAIYYMPVLDTRMCLLDEEVVPCTVMLYRKGEMQEITVNRRFRSYVQVTNDTQALRWFKTLGDPRPMDSLTGERKQTKNQATEVLWLKQPFGGATYGIPRYIGGITDVRGRSLAQFVNYDLFDHQGIAPVIVMVENGSLTDESRNELEQVFRNMRGPENFNRAVLIEAMPELQGLDDKSNVRIDIKNMNDYRHDDLMFINYLNKTENVIRQTFRLPPLYTGSSQEYSFATSYSSQQIAEEQVFNPERLIFDEIVNNKIIRPEFGSRYWIYRTKGPRVGSADQLRMVVKELVNAGALSVDNTIQIANELLGTQFSPYETEWSKMPAAFVRAMIQSGRMVLNEDGTLSFFTTPSDTGNPASHLHDGTNPLGR